MLVLKIVGGHSNGDLDIDPVGSSQPGQISADKGWPVKWQVIGGSGVKKILDISMKKSPPAPPSVAIFEHDPAPEWFSGKKKWKAKVKSGAAYGSTYHYDIDWVDKNDNKRTFDPKISVMPALLSKKRMLLPIVVGSVALLGLAALLKWNREKRKAKQQNNHYH